MGSGFAFQFSLLNSSQNQSGERISPSLSSLVKTYAVVKIEEADTVVNSAVLTPVLDGAGKKAQAEEGHVSLAAASRVDSGLKGSFNEKATPLSSLYPAGRLAGRNEPILPGGV